MRLKTLNKVSAGIAIVAGALGLWGSLATPSQAQAIQANTVFGCSIPGSGNREDPFGAAIEPANALIATPSSPTPAPIQASLAYFSTVGTFTGQARCLSIQARLNEINSPQNFTNLAGYVFGLGTAPTGEPVICFRQAGGSCAVLVEPLAFPAGTLRPLAPIEGYLVMTLSHRDTPPGQALNRLNTNLRSFAMTGPAIPDIDESNIN